MPIVYASDSDALAVLEVRVNLDLAFDLLPSDYALVTIEIDDNYPIEVARLSASDPYARTFGDEWLAASSAGQRAPVLRVPSIVAPRSHNLLLNPMAPGFTEAVQVVAAELFVFDLRLWRGA